MTRMAAADVPVGLSWPRESGSGRIRADGEVRPTLRKEISTRVRE